MPQGARTRAAPRRPFFQGLKQSPLQSAPYAPSESKARAETCALLARILARIGAVEAPIIQIMPCGSGQRTHDVALDLSIAAAGHFGRTLLVDAGGSGLAAPQSAQQSAPGFAADFIAGNVLPTVRDVFVPALHHAHLAAHVLDRRRGTDWLRAVLSATAQSFRLLTLDCACPRNAPDSLALAPLCSGTILVVQAGNTHLADVIAAARDIEAARGRVLGTVLTQIPASLPAWLDTQTYSARGWAALQPTPSRN